MNATDDTRLKTLNIHLRILEIINFCLCFSPSRVFISCRHSSQRPPGSTCAHHQWYCVQWSWLLWQPGHHHHVLCWLWEGRNRFLPGTISASLWHHQSRSVILGTSGVSKLRGPPVLFIASGPLVFQGGCIFPLCRNQGDPYGPSNAFWAPCTQSPFPPYLHPLIQIISSLGESSVNWTKCVR